MNGTQWVKNTHATNFDGAAWSLLAFPLGFDSFNVCDDTGTPKKLFRIWSMQRNTRQHCLLFSSQVSTHIFRLQIQIVFLLSFISGLWPLSSALAVLTGKCGNSLVGNNKKPVYWFIDILGKYKRNWNFLVSGSISTYVL